MRLRRLVIFTLPLLVLAGCGQPQGEKKEDFLLDTKKVSDFGQEVLITKPGRIAGAEEITVTSQVSGRIGAIVALDGKKVAGGQPVLQIKDSVANYDLQVQKAKNALDRAVIQYQQTKISVDKSLSDASTALEVAENSYTVSQAVTEQSLKKAKIDYDNTDVQIDTLQTQLLTEKNNISALIDSVLNQVDLYLGVTNSYKTFNDDYEVYLGARDVTQKKATEQLLLSLYTMKGKVKSVVTDNPSSQNIQDGVQIVDSAYKLTRNVLDNMRQVLLNSVHSVDSFPKTTIDGYKAIIDGLTTSVQTANLSFTAYRKQVLASLEVGSGKQIVQLNQEQADITYNTTLINSQNALFNSEVGVRNAKSAYETLMKNKDLQVGMVENSVSDAKVSYQDALSKFSKLSVRAPIAGVVGNILVDVGQEVGAGTPLFTLANIQNQMVEVYITSDEAKFVQLDQYAKVSYDGEDFTGTVLSISSVADKNTLYKVVVGLDRAVDLLGDVAMVSLPVRVGSPVLPLNVISPISANKGFVWVLHGTGLQRYDVEMGRIWDTFVQISSPLPASMDIVLSDVTNFDASKFVLKKEDN